MVEVAVLTAAALTIPSDPGWTDITPPSNHLGDGSTSSLMRTITSGRLVRDSLIRKCAGVRALRSEGLEHIGKSGRELRHASICVKTVEYSSNVNGVDPIPRCIIYHRRNSDTHSHNCRIANNNNTTHNHPFLCVCTAVKLRSQNVTSRHSVLFSLSLIVLPFLPASNLLFYVGFVVAERVLYIPSAGFCLLIGIASAKLWKIKKIRGYLCASCVLVLTGFIAKTVIRNWDWKNEESLFRSAISFNPPKEALSKLNEKSRIRAISQFTNQQREDQK
ncbi:hypothetical protein HUJ04_011140 [Dendroctonus ponderosae]|nr:hypothetical protein HUJ04_011140 [Dendroctonus ponderosae]